jgi:3,4-dihydroxy 2-butanone 4-phosphate synthase/GTP cyclohydrolase II
MNDDGTMARLPELVAFAQHHNLKIGAIADLIAYRTLHDHMIDKIVERPFESAYGEGFRIVIFRNRLNDAEYPALVKGEVKPDKPTLVRVQRADVSNDLLGAAGPRHDRLPRALKQLAAEEGAAVMVLVWDRGPHSLSKAIGGDYDRSDPEHRDRMLREYGVGAQILRELGVRQMVLLSDSPQPIVGLEGYGLTLVGWRSFKP